MDYTTLKLLNLLTFASSFGYSIRVLNNPDVGEDYRYEIYLNQNYLPLKDILFKAVDLEPNHIIHINAENPRSSISLDAALKYFYEKQKEYDAYKEKRAKRNALIARLTPEERDLLNVTLED